MYIRDLVLHQNNDTVLRITVLQGRICPLDFKCLWLLQTVNVLEFENNFEF
jgi:hypothetical protein